MADYHQNLLPCCRALLFGVLILSSNLYGDELRFTASPRYCPSEGPNAQCAKSLVLTWNAAPDKRYCLFRTEQSDPIMCWDNPAAKEITYNFPDKLMQSIEFSLIVMSTQGLQRKTITVEVSKPKNTIQKIAEKYGIARTVSKIRFRP